MWAASKDDLPANSNFITSICGCSLFVLSDISMLLTIAD